MVEIRGIGPGPHDCAPSALLKGRFTHQKNNSAYYNYQIYPLYHIVDDNQPVWEWNGHYSATATLTGFAYDYFDWEPVDCTQTIDAQITCTDTEGADEYSARERVYTAAAVTAGKTFYDYKREPLSPQVITLEDGAVCKIEEAINVIDPVTVYSTDGNAYGFFNGDSVTVHYDKDNAKLYLTKKDADYTVNVAEIKNDEYHVFTGYFCVRDFGNNKFALKPIYHYVLNSDTKAGWAWSEDNHNAQVTVNGNWYFYDEYSTNHDIHENYTAFTGMSPVTIEAEVAIDYTESTAEHSGSVIYNAKATLCDREFFDQRYETILNGAATLVGRSVSLDGDISINFYMELSDKLITDRNVAYMQFNVPSGGSYSKQRVYISDADIKKVSGKTYYVFKCRVAAKDMASKITAQIIDGSYAYDSYSYSVRDYAQYLLEHKHENEKYERAAPLVTAMINYGTAAQLYFGFNTDDLANSILDPEDRIYRAYTDFDIAQSYDDLPAGVFEGATLSLKSQTTLSIYFNSDEPLSFSCGDETVEKAAVDEYQVARIRNIPAARLSDTFILTVNGEHEVHYSPLNYCKLVLTSGSTSNQLKNVAGALYTYSRLADYYFGKTQPEVIGD